MVGGVNEHLVFMQTTQAAHKRYNFSLYFIFVYERSPRILRASWMSLGIIVTRFA